MIAVVIATLHIPGSAPLRGTLFGLAGSLFGISLFAAGALLGHAGLLWPTHHSRNISPRVRKPSVSPAEAKFWLQRFLAEHQGHEDRKSVE